MITSLKKKNNLAAMIRGKAIEEAIRFSYAFHRDQFSIPAAQNYANDMYYLRTKKLPPTVVKNNALPINNLVILCYFLYVFHFCVCRLLRMYPGEIVVVPVIDRNSTNSW